ncbi:hypothetical protein CPB86DRAFT_35984 [Serendipita vermifera]|nr:hypothetical protein CPB86DRAFT_35984 [Serendipita vermifera]
MSDWLLSNDFDLEGRCRSLLVQFLDNQRGTLRCLFDGCKKKFSRQDRAITHIRVHLAHRPFVCGGQCGNNYCRERYASRANLRSHWTRKSANCPRCYKSILEQNMNRHLRKCRVGHSVHEQRRSSQRNYD